MQTFGIRKCHLIEPDGLTCKLIERKRTYMGSERAKEGETGGFQDVGLALHLNRWPENTEMPSNGSTCAREKIKLTCNGSST